MERELALRWARTPWLRSLLLIALLARSLSPAGFMPGPGGLMLCPGYAPVMSESEDMNMPGMDMSDHAGPPSTARHSPDQPPSSFCPFAAAASATSPLASEPAALLVITFTGVLTHRIDPPPEPVRPHRTIVPTRLPRGPPSLA